MSGRGAEGGAAGAVALLALATVLALVVLAVSASRASAPSPGPGAGERGAVPAAPGDFGDGTWILRVDRAWDGVGGDLVFPSDPLAESAYRPVTEGPAYPVTVTLGTAAVAIGERPLRGGRIVGNPDTAYYQLDEGTFAGGRFVVWAAGDGLQAELTIYGSGRPIVRSERGALERAYHVATSGDDRAGTGSIDRPWATIGHAVNAGVPAAGRAS